MGHRQTFKYCTCNLSGHAYYTKRCPMCGLYREGNILHPPVTMEDVKRHLEWQKQKKEERKTVALNMLREISELCSEPIPSPPVPQRPSREMTREEEEQWKRKASLWAYKTKKAILAELHQPFAIFAKTTTEYFIPKRYKKAAINMLKNRLAKIREAGWHYETQGWDNWVWMKL